MKAKPMTTETLNSTNQQQRGNFIAGLNRGKPLGSKRPDFSGRLSVPGREQQHAFALWANKDKNGNTYFSGRIDRMPITDDIHAQIEALTQPVVDYDPTDLMQGATNLSLKPYEVVLFRNGYKDAENPKRPDFWGRVNMGDNTPPVAISVWLRQDRYQRPLLTGATTYPQPGKDAAATAGMAENAPEVPYDLPENPETTRRKGSRAGR